MTPTRWVCCLLIGVLAWVSATDAAQPTPESDPVIALGDRLPGLAERLGSLNPGDPWGYLALGEEIAAEATSDAEVMLAEHLFVLAFETERRAGAQSVAVQASASLALASLSSSDRRADWLRAIARVLDARYARPDWSGSLDPGLSAQSAFRAAEAIGAVRAGEGPRARDLLGRSDVRLLIDRYSALLTGAGPSDMLGELDAEASKWPCPECRNERVSVKRHTSSIDRSLCNTCGGDPGWPLTRAGLIATLRFESAMLVGVQRSWGAQLAIDLGSPLRDPDPAEVAPTYGVDPTRTVWRDGTWVAPPAASTMPPDPNTTTERTDP